MLKIMKAVMISKEILGRAYTLSESRFKAEYFTRKRKMPFENLLKFILSMYKTSAQVALNRFFEKEGSPMTMSQQALSKARNKFDHTPFFKLFTGVRDAFYDKKHHDSLHKFKDKLLIAIDGSETALPNIPALPE